MIALDQVPRVGLGIGPSLEIASKCARHQSTVDFEQTGGSGSRRRRQYTGSGNHQHSKYDSDTDSELEGYYLGENRAEANHGCHGRLKEETQKLRKMNHDPPACQDLLVLASMNNIAKCDK